MKLLSAQVAAPVSTSQHGAHDRLDLRRQRTALDSLGDVAVLAIDRGVAFTSPES
jgi:hypothetical protein